MSESGRASPRACEPKSTIRDGAKFATMASTIRRSSASSMGATTSFIRQRVRPPSRFVHGPYLAIVDNAMPLQLPNPPPSSENARNTMRANRGSNTGPELRLRAALRTAGLAGYRLNWRAAPGRPDIAYPGPKVAVFVHGCFWHRCPRCNPPNPKAHTEFWTRKFALNVERDARKRAQLEPAGWLVLEIWECDIRERLPESVAQVGEALASRPSRRR